MGRGGGQWRRRDSCSWRWVSTKFEDNIISSLPRASFLEFCQVIYILFPQDHCLIQWKSFWVLVKRRAQEVGHSCLKSLTFLGYAELFFREHSCFLYVVISESGLWTATKINNDKKVIFYLKLHHNISVALKWNSLRVSGGWFFVWDHSLKDRLWLLLQIKCLSRDNLDSRNQTQPS